MLLLRIKTNSAENSTPSFASFLCCQRQDCLLPDGDCTKFGKYCQKQCFPKCFPTFLAKNCHFVKRQLSLLRKQFILDYLSHECLNFGAVVSNLRLFAFLLGVTRVFDKIFIITSIFHISYMEPILP